MMLFMYVCVSGNCIVYLWCVCVCVVQGCQKVFDIGLAIVAKGKACVVPGAPLCRGGSGKFLG